MFFHCSAIYNLIAALPDCFSIVLNSCCRPFLAYSSQTHMLPSPGILLLVKGDCQNHVWPPEGAHGWGQICICCCSLDQVWKPYLMVLSSIGDMWAWSSAKEFATLLINLPLFFLPKHEFS